MGVLRRVKLLGRVNFSGAHILSRKKQKTIKSKSFQSNSYSEKVTVNSKHYHEYQPTCNILTKFKHQIESKLLYLLLDWETFS